MVDAKKESDAYAGGTAVVVIKRDSPVMLPGRPTELLELSATHHKAIAPATPSDYKVEKELTAPPESSILQLKCDVTPICPDEYRSFSESLDSPKKHDTITEPVAPIPAEPIFESSTKLTTGQSQRGTNSIDSQRSLTEVHIIPDDEPEAKRSVWDNGKNSGDDDCERRGEDPKYYIVVKPEREQCVELGANKYDSQYISKKNEIKEDTKLKAKSDRRQHIVKENEIEEQNELENEDIIQKHITEKNDIVKCVELETSDTRENITKENDIEQHLEIIIYKDAGQQFVENKEVGKRLNLDAEEYNDMSSSSSVVKKKEVKWSTNDDYINKVHLKEKGCQSQVLLLERKTSVGPCYRPYLPYDSPSGISLWVPKKSMRNIVDVDAARSGINVIISKKCVPSPSKSRTAARLDSVEELDSIKGEMNLKRAIKVGPDVPYSSFLEALRGKVDYMFVKIKKSLIK